MADGLLSARYVSAHKLEAALPNSFAYFMLCVWPLVSVILFVRLPVEKAAIWSLLGGWLLLPSATAIKVPLIPPLDKVSIPAMSTFLLCHMKGSLSPRPQRSLLVYFLALTWFFVPVLSTFNNSYEIQIGNRSLPGFYPLDGLKLVGHNVIALAPFFVGMRFLSSGDARVLLIRALPVAGLFYSVPMLFEIRFSPQLHRWVYGFFPHSFQQQIRDGGFRPVVFLDHGLEVALFASLAVIAALIMTRAKQRIFQKPAALICGYLAAVLLLCKTWSANIYLIIATPIVLLTTPKTWVKFSFGIVLVVCAYPLLRTYDIVPVHRVMEAANSISATRASSFQMRVKNEDILLAKANKKPFLGWGAWGRNRVYAEGTGEDISVTDGEWIIQFGSWGWLGYLSFFGLFAASVFRARGAVRGPITQNGIAIGGLSLLVAVNLADLIPNSALLPFTFLAAGSLAGVVRVQSAKKAGLRTVSGSAPAVAAS